MIMLCYFYRHVSSNDKMGKRYRETKFMFSIEDDDDEAGLIVCIYACQYMALF